MHDNAGMMDAYAQCLGLLYAHAVKGKESLMPCPICQSRPPISSARDAIVRDGSPLSSFPPPPPDVCIAVRSDRQTVVVACPRFRHHVRAPALRYCRVTKVETPRRRSLVRRFLKTPTLTIPAPSNPHPSVAFVAQPAALPNHHPNLLPIISSPHDKMLATGRGSIAQINYTGDEAAGEIKKLLDAIVCQSSCWPDALTNATAD